MTNEQLLTLMRFRYHLARMIAGQIANRDEIVREAHLEASRCIDELKEECEPPPSYWVLQHVETKAFVSTMSSRVPTETVQYVETEDDPLVWRCLDQASAERCAKYLNLWKLLEPYKVEAAPCP